MKRFLLWIVGVAVGVAALLAAVMAASYSFTGEGSLPQGETRFGGQALEQNGYCWHVPLLGGALDKTFASPANLTVQKLGTLYEAHPALETPEWTTAAVLTITDDAGTAVFRGSLAEYDAFLYPANGGYKAELELWRLPEGMTIAAFAPASGGIRRNDGLERPARATGYYHYLFRYTLQAAPEVELSAERLEQGGVAGVHIGGMVGSGQPTVETDLGSVQCVRTADGWRGYIPAAYNAAAGAHTVTITVNGETVEKTLTVIPRDFGTAETDPEPEATEAANAEFRNTVWALYEQPAAEKRWAGAWLCPLERYVTLVDYGQVKVVDGAQGSRSNSTRLYAIPGDPVRAPAAGQVVLAQELALTGKTVVIDHGCGMRSYLYGLATLDVRAGDTLERGTAVGAAGEELTMDFKLGSKSVNPWSLFQGAGGLFWRENE